MTIDAEQSWYVLKNDQQIGPIPEATFRQSIEEGLIRKTDLIWRQGLSTWTAAEELLEFGEDKPSRLKPPPLPKHAFLSPKIAQELAPPPLPKGFALSRLERNGQPVGAGSSFLALAPAEVSAHEHNHGASQTTTQKVSYLAQHWRGKLSLPTSYWFNGFLGYLIATFAVTAIGASSLLRTDFSPGLSLFSIIGVWATTFVVLCWQVVGTWRSATKHTKSNTTALWPAIAKVSLCIAVILTLAQFVSRGVPQIREMYRIYEGDEEVGKYRFRVLRDGQEMEFTGGITFGAAKEFDRFIEALGGLKLVHLNSRGGRISEAQKMGEIIRRHGLSTYVSGDCLSACTIIFLNGRDRLINAKSRVGFHQPYFPGMTEESKRDTIEFERRRLERLGVSPMFSRKANTYTPEQMWFPGASELLSEHVATRLVDASDYGISGLGLEALSDVQLQKILTDIPIYKAIQIADPVTFNDIAVRFISGFRRGVMLAELTDQISPLVETVFTARLPFAAEEQLIAYTNLAIRKQTRLFDVDPADCYFYLNSRKSSSTDTRVINDLLKEFLQQELILKASVIGSQLKIEMPTEQKAELLRARLVSKLKLDSKLDVSLLNAEEIRPERYRTYCLTSIAMLKAALDFPRKDRETLLRVLYK
jgi:hypothetical protein